MTRSISALVGLLLVVAAVGPAAVGTAVAADVTLTVSVSSSLGGTVDGAELTATWDGGSTTETTSANGQALLDVPEGADVTIEVQHEDYVRNRPLVVENAQSRNVRLTLGERGAASVTVTGDGPVSGASVRFIDDGQTAAQASTGEDGVARIDPIEQGTYDVTVTKGGYFRERLTIGVGADTERRVGLQRGNVQVTFNVTDDHFEDLREIENATVDIQPIGTSLVTLSDGQATTRLPVNRDYDVTVTKPGYQTVSRSLPVSEGAIEFDVAVARTPTLSMTAANQRVVVGETTRVTVTNEYDEPAAGVAILVDGAEIRRTNEDGEATVPISAAGSLTVRAVYEGTEAAVTVEGVQAGGQTGSASPTGNDTSTDGGIGPGFGPLTALLAVALAVVGLRRRA